MNRRAFDEIFAREAARSARDGQPLSLLMIDIDWFKAYNDTYGHPMGDQCLRLVSACLADSVKRPADTGSLLIFTHIFADRAGAASFAAGWQACLDAMDDVLAGRPVQDEGRDAMDAAHERYVADFGLADGWAEDTEDGWRVSFERQLVRPAETVWAALSGGAPPVPGARVPASLTVRRTGFFPATRWAVFNTSIFSSWLSIGPSPSDPATIRPSTPASIWSWKQRSISAWSRVSFLVNLVVTAGITPAHMAASI